jgi:asparagine synthetase B (glutamine-hydrolysing)
VAASLPPHPHSLLLPSVTHEPASFVRGVRLDKEVAPYERSEQQSLDDDQHQHHLMHEAAAAAAANLLPQHLPPSSPLHSLPPASQLLYAALRQSMQHRVGLLCTPPSASHARVGLLFSGGLDCSVLALLAHEVLPPGGEPIDLITVAFCGHLRQDPPSLLANFVPDRVTAINAWRELRALTAREAQAKGTEPRQWNLITVNVTLAMLERHRAHILSLLRPSATIMDFNIAAVLWFGARAKGQLYREDGVEEDSLPPAEAVATPSATATAAAGEVELIQSRLARISPSPAPPAAAAATVAASGAAASATSCPSDAALSSAADSASLSLTLNTHKPAPHFKGKPLPPELVAKLAAVAAAHPSATGRLQQQQSTQRAPVTAAASPDGDDDADPAPDDSNADGHVAGADGVAKKLSKSDRRALKNRERNLIRRHFRAAAGKAHQDALEEMHPAAEDFLTPEEERVYDEEEQHAEEQHEPNGTTANGAAGMASHGRRRLYTSHAKVLLIGIGADELMAGYGRHRTVWLKAGGKEVMEAAAAAKGKRNNTASMRPSVAAAASGDVASVSSCDSSAANAAAAAVTAASASASAALRAELSSDFARLWRRNLGRDDRVVGDSGREARHPYLDEGVLHTLMHVLPLDAVADLSRPPGEGDKRVLRMLAGALGLSHASRLVKRAMQFGTRFANKNVAGALPMTEHTRMHDIVNAHFLRPEARTAAAAAADGREDKSEHAAATAGAVAPPQSKRAQKRAAKQQVRNNHDAQNGQL